MSNWAFLTDIHLDHLKDDQAIIDFIDRCKDDSFDGYLITGDISNGVKIVEHLSMLEAGLQKQIVFCLGNHDFWHSSFSNVRRRMGELQNLSPLVKYITNSNYIPVSAETAIVGHDGWYDGLNGDAKASKFLMQDWLQIQEYAEITRGAQRFEDINKNAVIELSQQLASDAVKHVHKSIKDAVRYHKHIVVLTHVPPWEEAHRHQGLPGNSHASPWFTSRMMGMLLESAANSYKNVQFTVLCGHTHGHCFSNIKPNLTCHVGHADYVNPVVQDVLSL